MFVSWPIRPSSSLVPLLSEVYSVCNHLANVDIYKCIGAKLRILLHFIFFNSVPTTPFNLVPIGSPVLDISTQALSSNLTTEPSGRCNFFFVRTTTAWRMSPRRTLLAAEVETEPDPGPDSGPKLRCFWTTTMMRSPRRG